MALALCDSIAGWEKFSASAGTLGMDGFMQWEAIPLTDYLINYLNRDNRTWRDLYLGERLKQLHWQADSLDEMIARRERVMTADRDALLKLLHADLEPSTLDLLARTFNEMIDLVTIGARSTVEVKILLVGDCLFLDLSTFLTLPLLEFGVTLRPVFATSKNPIELRSTLRGLAGEKFDLICYSPYSYEFSPQIAQTHYPKGALIGRRELLKNITEAHHQTMSTLRLLTELFDTPLFLHNTANIRRHNSTLASYAKNLVTRPSRRYAAREANVLLSLALAEHNSIAHRPVVLIDELALVAKYGELALGKKYYDSEPQHPTVMALKLSGIYRELIAGAKLLFTRKVVVTDLDHTLWAGIIGEGAVVHERSRQQVLKLLKHKGIVLAIASKNDPEKVHWTGALLQEEDFVASQISWNPKTISIKRIAEELNLKTKDFVFIDDRADEREMVRMAIPGIQALDATSESSWRMLEWWASALPEQNETDRTQLYHERKQRQVYLDEAQEKRDQDQLLLTLDLRLEIRTPNRKELARVAELVNRTNQFNMCGSRTTLQQITAWNESSKHRVLVAEAADKFGAMGIVSVMVVEISPDAVEIPLWVLSCRVFGYGIENAMLNYLNRLSSRLGRNRIHGRLLETPNNQPCRNVYPSNGFVHDGSVWYLEGESVTPDPAWLTIQTEDEATLTAGR